MDNRRTLPGSWVYAEMEGQGPCGRHQATGHDGREDDGSRNGAYRGKVKKEMDEG